MLLYEKWGQSNSNIQKLLTARPPETPSKLAFQAMTQLALGTTENQAFLELTDVCEQFDRLAEWLKGKIGYSGVL
jgi:hypothetical protein